MEAPSVADSASLYDRNENWREHAMPLPHEAEIVEVRMHHDGRFSVRLDTGEVWRETEGSRIRTPKPGQWVEVYKGTTGGYRMKIEGRPKLAWVRRVD